MGTLAENLDKLIKDKGLKEGELEELSGIKQGTINKIRRGVTVNPKHDNVKALAKALGVGEFDLYPGNHSISEPRPTYNTEPITPRQKIFLELIESLPKIEQEELMRELEEKKLYWERVIDELKSRKSY